jgi:hypothetical protein
LPSAVGGTNFTNFEVYVSALADEHCPDGTDVEDFAVQVAAEIVLEATKENYHSKFLANLVLGTDKPAPPSRNPYYFLGAS